MRQAPCSSVRCGFYSKANSTVRTTLDAVSMPSAACAAHLMTSELGGSCCGALRRLRGRIEWVGFGVRAWGIHPGPLRSGCGACSLPKMGKSIFSPRDFKRPGIQQDLRSVTPLPQGSTPVGQFVLWFGCIRVPFTAEGRLGHVSLPASGYARAERVCASNK